MKVTAVTLAVVLATTTAQGAWPDPAFEVKTDPVDGVVTNQASFAPPTLSGGNGASQCTTAEDGSWTTTIGSVTTKYFGCTAPTATAPSKAKNRIPFAAARNEPLPYYCFTGNDGSTLYNPSKNGKKNEWALCDAEPVQFTAEWTASGNDVGAACRREWNYNNRSVAGNAAPIYFVTNSCVRFSDLQPHTETLDLSNVDDVEDRYWCFIGEGDGYNPNKESGGSFDPKVLDWGFCADAAQVVAETGSPTAAPSAEGAEITESPTSAPIVGTVDGTDSPTSAPVPDAPTEAPTDAPTSNNTSSPTPSAAPMQQAASVLVCTALAMATAAWQ